MISILGSKVLRSLEFSFTSESLDQEVMEPLSFLLFADVLDDPHTLHWLDVHRDSLHQSTNL